MTDTGKADYIAARASESLSYGDIAYAQGQGWCSSSPDGMGPHRPDDTTDPVTCAECGALIDVPPTEAEIQAGLPGQVRGLVPPIDDRAEWSRWLRGYGAEAFYDAFMRTAQGALSRCTQCGEAIALDIREGGGVPDWGNDGDYGCWASPDTGEDGTGGHTAEGTEG